MSTPPEPSQREGLPATIDAICAHIGGDRFPPGDRAALRRGGPPGFIFWKITQAFGLSTQKEEGEQKAAVVLQALATLAGNHNRHKELGEALALAGLSELRLGRLLKAQDAPLHDEVRAVARYLSVKAKDADLYQLAALVLIEQDEAAEQLRRRIARSYFRALATQDK
jgi:CRISPR system Cascade subunit CasB